MLRGVRECEGRDRVLLLAVHVQHCAACNEEVHVRGTVEEVEHIRAGGDDLLEVVQDEEEVFVAQSRTKAFQQGLSRRFNYAQCLGDSGEHHVRIADGSKGDEIGPIRVATSDACCNL
jgi:hypothetical protein